MRPGKGRRIQFTNDPLCRWQEIRQSKYSGTAIARLGAGRWGGRTGDVSRYGVGIPLSSLIRRFGFWVEKLFDLGKV